MKYTNLFLEYLKSQNKSETTIETYRNVLTKIYKTECSEDEIINWNLDDFKSYIKRLQDKGEQPNTINKKISTLNSFFSFLCLTGVVDVNIPKQLGKIKIDKKRVKFLEEDEARILRDKANKCCIRDKFLINLLLSSGLRIFEAENLKIEDIDIKTGLLRVENGKGRKYREVLLPNEVIDMYEEWLLIRGTIKDIKEDSKDYIFISRNKEKLKKRQMQNIITKLADECGLDITAHGLRHTFATMLVNANVQIKDVQVVLGHTLESTTEAIYVHATRKNLQNCRDNNPLYKNL